jgi:hypothetical protein
MKRMEKLELNPHIYGQMIFNQGEQDTQWRKNGLFNKWFWENAYPHAKE